MSDTSSPSCPSFPSCPDGLLLVDKPRGVTSFDAVAAVRGALHTKKVGHAGTLDPMATGLLVIAFGRATRLLQYIVEHDKTYEATIRLGARTTTDDAEGDLLVAHVVPWRTDAGDRREPVSRETPSAARPSASVPASVAMPSPERIETVIAERFTGDIEQVPNTFSAIKIGGRRAYDLAREGKDVELKARPVRIGEFTVLGVRRGFASVASTTSPLIAETAPAAASSSGVSPVSPDGSTDVSMDASTGVPSDALPHDGVIPVIDVDVRVSCSSGTYIRALARDLGEALGVGGYLTRLRRTRVGRFALPDDRSGLAAVTAMPADTDVAGEGRIRVIGAHAEPKTFTNRDGETITRNRCVLDTPNGLSGEARGGWLRACAIGMADAARGAMPVVVITADEARELRFGRRIERELDKGVHYAAIVPAEGADVATGMGAGAGADVAAIIERANRTQAKPVVVFPAE